jgi:hypothetical protein
MTPASMPYYQGEPGRGLIIDAPPAERVLAYWLNEPVCCSRVADASPPIVLPLWKVAAFATGTTAALRLKAAKAARMRFFIGTLHLQSGGMSGFDGELDGPPHPAG